MVEFFGQDNQQAVLRSHTIYIPIKTLIHTILPEFFAISTGTKLGEQHEIRELSVRPVNNARDIHVCPESQDI